MFTVSRIFGLHSLTDVVNKFESVFYIKQSSITNIFAGLKERDFVIFDGVKEGQ